jgi:hypothetical protein
MHASPVRVWTCGRRERGAQVRAQVEAPEASFRLTGQPALMKFSKSNRLAHCNRRSSAATAFLFSRPGCRQRAQDRRAGVQRRRRLKGEVAAVCAHERRAVERVSSAISSAQGERPCAPSTRRSAAAWARSGRLNSAAKRRRKRIEEGRQGKSSRVGVFVSRGPSWACGDLPLAGASRFQVGGQREGQRGSEDGGQGKGGCERCA